MGLVSTDTLTSYAAALLLVGVALVACLRAPAARTRHRAAERLGGFLRLHPRSILGS